MVEYPNETQVLKFLEEPKIDTLFGHIKRIYAEKKWHTREKVLIPFHEGVMKVLRDKLKECPKKQYDIRWLVSRLLELSQKTYFWHKESSATNIFIDNYGSAENFLFELWEEEIKQNDKDRRLIKWLEDNYQLITKSVGLCLKRYAFAEAFRIKWIYGNFLLGTLEIIFTTPLFAGIVVGWLFLLQAGDAIRYITFILIEYTPISVLIPIGLGTLFISGLFIYINGKKKRPRNLGGSSFKLVFAAFCLSYIFGYVIINLRGIDWFILTNGDKIIQKAIDAQIDIKELVPYFIPIWASLAVFIGIFAQIVWSDRGPIDISE